MMANDEATSPVVLVVGAHRGIGAAVVRHLLDRGYRVAAVNRAHRSLFDTGGYSASPSAQILELRADALDEASLKRAIARTTDEWGQIDGLVNNVGGLKKPADFESLSGDDWVDAFLLNVVAPATAIKLCLPHLRGRSSSVVNIASFVAHQPGRWNPHYSSSKAALINLTKHLAGVFAPEGIRVSSVSPGHIETETWLEGLAERARELEVSAHEVLRSERRRIEQGVPMQRLGEPDEVAAVVEFLLSPQSRYVTGVDIRVDGGKVGFGQFS